MTKAASLLRSEWVRNRLYYLFAPLVTLALVALLQQTRLAQQLEYLTVNLRFQLRAPFDPPADPRLVFVGIDQQSLDVFGAWPWSRTIEGQLLADLAETEKPPHTVAFDLLFTEQFDKYQHFVPTTGAKYDDRLSDAAGELASVVTGALSIAPVSKATEQEAAENRTRNELAQPSLTVPISNIRGDISRLNGWDVAALPFRSLRQQSFFGFVNDDPSPVDGVRHTIPLLMRVQGKVFPSFALEVLCQMLSVDPDKIEVDLPSQEVRLKALSGKLWTIPIDEKGQYAINYRSEQSFTGISFVALSVALETHLTSKNGKPGPPLDPKADMGNKVLIVGQVATGLSDLGPTPLQSQSPLPYTHLNVINNVLHNDYLHFVPWYWVVAGWLLVTWATLLRMKESPLYEAVGLPVLLAVIYAAIAIAIFGQWSVQVDMAWPILSFGAVSLGAVVLRWRGEQQGRFQMKLLFSRMLSPEVMDHLLDHPENMKLGGSDRAVTILFTDIRDYTKFSEGLSAGELVRQLNIYFERMVACVKEHRGTFHKFIGDAIMAAWGDIVAGSLGAKEDACNAVRAALDMRRQLRELNDERHAEGLVPLRIGMGLNHGEVLAGLIGASTKSEFTVMGDAVNIASRLEGMTKEFCTDLAVSESVRQFLGDAFLVRRLGLIQLKGKTRPMVVYEVLAEKTDLRGAAMTEEGVARYEEAFTSLLARRFNEAADVFQACEEWYPNDYCIQLYLKVSREFSLHPPPPDWDGRIVMESK